MSNKKHILIFSDWYLPGFKAGGPIQSVANIVEHLKNDFDFSIITRNCDLHSTEAYPAVESDKWTTTNTGTRVYYISNNQLNARTIKKIAEGEKYDIIYLNSLFSYLFTLVPLRMAKKSNQKVILAPRGMLGAGALQIKKIKKKLFLFWAKTKGLYSNITWHASTELEKKEIQAVFGQNARVTTALNLPKKLDLILPEKKKEKNNLQLFFLSRITPKKNLLKIFDYLKSIPNEISIDFDIIGTIEDEVYWEKCQEQIREIKKKKKNISISFIGPLPNAELPERLKKYHFLILPTLHENFGHVILDALSAGCGLIISDQTPWKDLYEKQIGWDIPLQHDESFVQAITEAAKMDQNIFLTWSGNSFNEALNISNNKKIISDNKSLFEQT